MKKQILLLAMFILLGFSKANCQTQVPDWAWAKGAPSYSQGLGEGWSIATDKSNNVYVTGWFNESIKFGSFNLVTNHVYTFFLAKYDPSGNVKWAKSVVSSANAYSEGYNICTDLSCNVYITGYFNDTVAFGSFNLTSAGQNDFFLVKYDSSGNALWAKSAGGTSDSYGLGISTDLSGKVYVTGYFFTPSISFGSYFLTNAGVYDIFIAKYDSSGNVLWAKSAGGSGDDRGYGITTDKLSNVFITGRFASPIIAFGSDTLTDVGGYDVFLAKYDSSGHILWAKSAGGTSIDVGNYIAADASDNVYITGWYNSPSISFGSYTLTASGGYDAFLVKYDSSGNVSRAKSIGGAGDEYGYCITVDKSSKVFVSGSFTSSSLAFDTITVHQPVFHPDPMFVAGYDSSGLALWAKALGSGGDDQNAVATSPSGCIYIGGDLTYSDPFIIGNDSLHLSGLEEVFIAKLCYSDSGQGISEISTTKEFILYPNPFEDKLNVTASPPTPLRGRGEEEELTLFDVFGRVLLRRSFINQATINTEQLARGMYFYEVRDKEGVGARGKAIKQ